MIDEVIEEVAKKMDVNKDDIISFEEFFSILASIDQENKTIHDEL